MFALDSGYQVLTEIGDDFYHIQNWFRQSKAHEKSEEGWLEFPSFSTDIEITDPLDDIPSIGALTFEGIKAAEIRSLMMRAETTDPQLFLKGALVTLNWFFEKMSEGSILLIDDGRDDVSQIEMHL